MKTYNFSETIAACDLKIGRYKQLIELMKTLEYSRSKSFLDHWAIFKQILYVSLLVGKGDENSLT